MVKAMIAAAFACGASAQNWGTSGAWEPVFPVPTGSPPVVNSPTRAYHHAAWVPGSFVVAGNDTSQQANGAADLYLYNIAKNTWSAPFDYIPAPASGPILYPFIFSTGGIVGAVDEAAPNVLYTIDSALPSGPWTTVSVSGAPLGRFAQRFLPWGSTLFMFGGVNAAFTPITQNNDLYALDLTAAITAAGSSNWTLISPPAVNGVLVPNYPEPRVGYSWTSFSVGALMYGGLSTSTPGGDPFACIRDPTTTGCLFHQHIWIFLPGLGDTRSKWPGGMPGAAWERVEAVGAQGGPIPDGRVEHTAGAMGDQLYVYGGVTANGPSSELWAFNYVSRTWALIPATNPAPPTSGRGSGFATGAVIGRHFYIFSQAFVPGAVAPGTGQLWRWTPSSSFPPPPSNNNAANNAVIQGHTAGIVIGILIGLFNVYVLVLLANNAGVSLIPSSLPSLPSFGGVKASPAGFYSSSTSSAGADGGYMAPPA